MGRAFEVRKASMAKTAAAKAKVYSRFGKEIYVTAKAGIPDPEMNMALKRMVEKARSNQVPADVIKRAIEKAKGGTGESYTSITYEGFGSGGEASILVECLTDNTNRSLADVRGAFNKAHAKLGVGGSVSHGYTNTGILCFEYQDEDQMLDTLLEAEIDVYEIEVEGNMMTVTVSPSDLHKAKNAIEALLPEVTFEVLETEMIAGDYVVLEGDDLERFERLVTLLNDVDDVQKIYHNVENVG